MYSQLVVLVVDPYRDRRDNGSSRTGKSSFSISMLSIRTRSVVSEVGSRDTDYVFIPKVKVGIVLENHGWIILSLSEPQNVSPLYEMEDLAKQWHDRHQPPVCTIWIFRTVQSYQIQTV